MKQPGLTAIQPSGWGAYVSDRGWQAMQHERMEIAVLVVLMVAGWWMHRRWLRAGQAWLRRAKLSERLRETYMIPHSGLELRIGLDIGGSLAKLVFLEKQGVKTPFLDFIVRLPSHAAASA